MSPLYDRQEALGLRSWMDKVDTSPAAQSHRPDLLVITDPLWLEPVRVPAGELVMGTRTEDSAGLLKAYGGEQAGYESSNSKYASCIIRRATRPRIGV